MSGVRAAVRIARREAWRSKGRSALVVAMVGVPMLALSFADVAIRTGQLPPEVGAQREIGAADLVATFVAPGPIRQYGLETMETPPHEVRAPGRVPPDLAPVLPPGSRVVPRDAHGFTDVRAGDRAVGARVERLDLHDPMSDGLVRLLAGTFPQAAGEVALTRRLANDLDVAPGATVTVRGVRGTLRVTGVVLRPSELKAHAAYVPTAMPAPRELGGGGSDGGAQQAFAVDLPPGVDDVALVEPLNQLGYRVKPRTWLVGPPPDADGLSEDAAAVGAFVVVGGLAALEIVLLAGAAFAVGARRRRRELALVAATGGDRKDVRRVVLAGGAVLGAVAGAVAVAGGIAAVALLRPVLGTVSGEELGPLDVRPLELAAIVALATGTSLLAALLPARAAARFPVIAGLTGRRGDTPPRKRVPVFALTAVAIGTALAFWAARAAYAPVRKWNGASYYETYEPGNKTLLVLAGAALAELGFVACAPAVVALLGRLATRLPLSLRLAARDAARHRTRSGPAVAAVVAAVAGSVALSVYLASDAERQRREYEPFLVAGGVRISDTSFTGAAVPRTAVDAAVAKLPVRERIDSYAVATTGCGRGHVCGSWFVDVPAANACRSEDVTCLRNGPVGGEARAGSPALVEWATGRTDDAVTAAMRDGKAVVFDARLLTGGTVTLAREPRGRQRVEVPAVAFDAKRLGEAPAVVLTPETARRYGLPLLPSATYLLTSRMPKDAEIARARGALGVSAPDIYVERGLQSTTGLELLALAGAAAFVTLAATGIATGLAAADSRPDLATLAAVGAAPRVRRRLVMAQAATVAVVGSVLGVLAGFVPAAAIVTGQSEFPIVLPWRTLALTVVGVPVAAALVVGALTRARLPMERRVA